MLREWAEKSNQPWGCSYSRDNDFASGCQTSKLVLGGSDQPASLLRATFKAASRGDGSPLARVHSLNSAPSPALARQAAHTISGALGGGLGHPAQ